MAKKRNASQSRRKDRTNSSATKNFEDDYATATNKFKDDYATLVMHNIHDSLKWVFAVLMGAAAYRAAFSLFEVRLKYIDSGTLALSSSDNLWALAIFLVFALTFFRFYWGWVRYLDVKYFETPKLISLLRKKIKGETDESPTKKCKEAFHTALKCSRHGSIIADGIMIFFQTVLIFLLADTITLTKPVPAFTATYTILLLFNAALLTAILLMKAWHIEALQQAFGEKRAAVIAPNTIAVWVANNILCFILIILVWLNSEDEFLRNLLWVQIMFANCLLDFTVARKMYIRNTNTLWETVDIEKKHKEGIYAS